MKTEISHYEQQAIDFLAKTKTVFKSEFLKYGSMNWDKQGDERNIFNLTLTNSRGSASFEFGASINDSVYEKDSISIIETDEDIKIFYGFSHAGNAKNIMFCHEINTSYPVLLQIDKGDKKLTDIIDTEKLFKDFFKYKEQIEAYNKKQKNNRHLEIRGSNINDITKKICQRIQETINEAKTTKTKIKIQKDTIKHPTAYDLLACLTKYDPGTFEDFCSEYGYDTDSRSAERTYNAVVKEWEGVSKLFNEQELKELIEIQ